MLKPQLHTKALIDINAQLYPRRYEIAISSALNDTATEVQQHIQNRMKVVFDRPTR